MPEEAAYPMLGTYAQMSKSWRRAGAENLGGSQSRES